MNILHFRPLESTVHVIRSSSSCSHHRSRTQQVFSDLILLAHTVEKYHQLLRWHSMLNQEILKKVPDLTSSDLSDCWFIWSKMYTVSQKKTVQTYFLSELCQISTDCKNFWHKDSRENRLLFSTSPNLCQHTTMWNTDVQNCYLTL